MMRLSGCQINVWIYRFVLTQCRHWQTDGQRELVKQYRNLHTLHADAQYKKAKVVDDLFLCHVLFM